MNSDNENDKGNKNTAFNLEKTFDPEIYVIEDEIINYLLNTALFEGRDQFFLKVFGLFMTRQYLSQKTIKQVTGFSVGKISEEVNLLLEMGLIQIAHTTKYGKIIYEASSAGILLLTFTKTIIQKLASWREKLIKMKEDLDEKKEDLKDLYGYDEIYEKTAFNLEMIEKYGQVFDKIEQSIRLMRENEKR